MSTHGEQLEATAHDDSPPAIPWEDRPAGSAAPLWRSHLNPIIALPDGCVAVDARIRARQAEPAYRTKTW